MQSLGYNWLSKILYLADSGFGILAFVVGVIYWLILMFCFLFVIYYNNWENNSEFNVCFQIMYEKSATVRSQKKIVELDSSPVLYFV